MIQSIIKITVALIFVIILFIAVKQIFQLPFENLRKLLHFFWLAMMCVWLYAFDDCRLGIIAMVVFIVIAYCVLLVFERYPFIIDKFPERKRGEFKQSLLAASFMYIFVSLIGWGLLKQRPLVLAAFFAWGPGDAAAALIGKRFGKTKIGRKKKKSLEGSLAMYLMAFICVASILIYNEIFVSSEVLIVSGFTALTATIVELEVLSGYDTFYIPLISIVVLGTLYYFLG